MLKLQFKDHRKAAIWLVDSRYAMGRDKSNDIVIDEEGISNFHAELRVEDDDRVFITDAGSISGTFVNDKQIKARTQLRAGDVIRLNKSELHLVDPKEQLKAQPEDSATAISPALQGLSVSNRQASGPGVGGVPVGWLLRGKTGSIAGEAFPIPPTGRAILGRSQTCDIVLPGTHVSRQHAELYFQSGRLHVKDLGSSNGTYVNRKKVQEGVVNPGDELRFDTLVFQVEAPEAPVVEETAGDKTMFRPAVTAAPAAGQPAAATAAPARPAAAPAAKPAATKPAQPAATRPAPAPVQSGSSSSKVGLIVAAVAVAGLIGVAWFVMS
ncbi:MAG: FHA domain-containing protein [Alcanivoracaceae bacterium]|nr:FHA domain-containing protein [Alcanivoracaceae bacterium]